METKYYKVVGEGCKTKEGYQWHPGKWNEEPNGVKDGKACGVGLHVFNDRPNWNYTRYMSNCTYRVIAVSGLLGRDDEKSRFMRVKLDDHPMTLSEIMGKDKDGFAGASLSYADLSYANLIGAYLSDANLSHANLSGADLSGADLSGVNLFHANLIGADLSGANLSYADLSYVNLIGAYLSDADLTNAHGLKDCNILTSKQRKVIHC